MAKKSFITAGIFALLAIGLLFLFWNSPAQSIKEFSNFNLLLIGGVASLVIFTIQGGKDAAFFEVDSRQDFFNDAALGVVFGVGVVAFTMIFLQGAAALVNLVGSIPASTVLDWPIEVQFFSIWVQPLTETILLVGGFLLFRRFLPSIKFGGFDFKVAIAFFLIALLFAVFHFAARGTSVYSNDVAGLLNFSFSTNGLGTAGYVGALPQFVLGALWVGLALGFKSWPVAAFSHVTSNAIQAGYAIGFFTPVVFGSLLLLIGIVFLVWKKNRFSELKTWSWGRITSA